MEQTRRSILRGGAALAAAGIGSLAGCTGNGPGTSEGSGNATAQASFFVFGEVVDGVAGEAASTALLTPIGQHGHGWEPGPRVREDIRDAALFVHGMEGFQPWVDNILEDLEADDTDVTSLDVTTGVDLLDTDDEHDGDGEDDNEHGTVDPHFWMDPLRVSEAVGSARRGFVDIDPENAEAYVENAELFREDLEDLHDRIESTIADTSGDVLLVAGHNAFSYLADRYGIEVHALGGLSPNNLPTTRDIDRAKEVIETHGLQHVCADPLESQQAAEQLIEETDAEEVLPLTAMPGIAEAWIEEDWGYLEVMENVNLPTLETALDT